MNTTLPATVHSADVKLSLRLNGDVYPLAKVGPDRLTMATATDLPAGDAVVSIHIDGREYRSPVHLPQGASGHSPFVVITGRNGNA